MTGLLLALALAQTPVDLRLYKGSPPSSANAIPVSLGAGSSTIGKVDQGAPAGSTVPWVVQLADGGHTILVINTTPVGTEYALPVRQVGTVTVAGTVTTTPPSNASTNLAQVAGATTATGNGTAAGSIRVSVASDSTGVLGATESGTWTVQPGNTANSTPWLTTDSATSSTGSAPPAKAAFVGARESTNMVGLIQCDKIAKADIATATTTSLIAVSGSTTIYVCSYAIEIQGVVTTAGTNVLEYGTGAACTTPVAVTPTWTGSTTAGNPTMIVQGSNTGYLLKTIASQGLCSLTTTTTPQRVLVSYAQF